MEYSTFFSLLPVVTSRNERRAVLKKLLNPKGAYVHRGSVQALETLQECDIAFVACIIELSSGASKKIDAALWSLAAAIASRGNMLASAIDTRRYAHESRIGSVFQELYGGLDERFEEALTQTKREKLLKKLQKPRPYFETGIIY